MLCRDFLDLARKRAVGKLFVPLDSFYQNIFEDESRAIAFDKVIFFGFEDSCF